MCLEKCLLSIPVIVYFIEIIFSLFVLNSKPDLVSACFTGRFPIGPVNQGGWLSDSRLLMGKPFVPWDNSFSVVSNFIFGFHWHFVLVQKVLDIPWTWPREALPFILTWVWDTGVLHMAVLLAIILIPSRFCSLCKLAYKPWCDKNDSICFLYAWNAIMDILRKNLKMLTYTSLIGIWMDIFVKKNILY